MNPNKLLNCRKEATLPTARQRQSTCLTSNRLGSECLNPEKSLSGGSYESGCSTKANNLNLADLGSVKVLLRYGSTVSGKDQHGTKDAHVMSYQLHLVPELHLASVVPVAQVAIDEQNDQREDGGQDLGSQADVVAGEEGQSQHPKQHPEQHQSDFTSSNVVQIGLSVLFAVLEGVHLVAKRSTAVVRITKDIGLYSFTWYGLN